MVKINHESKTLQQSLGIEENRADEISALVMFNMINQTYMIQHLYDSPDEAPRSMKTKTGVLENVLNEVSGENEIILATWEAARFDAIIELDEEHASKLLAMFSMMYMMADRKKDNFIKQFLKHKKKAMEMRENGELDD